MAKRTKKKRKGKKGKKKIIRRRPVRLDAAALDWALEHVHRFGDTVFLPTAFEYDAIDYCWDDVREWLLAQDMLNWQPRPMRRFLANKGPHSYRYITQLDPLENLAFTALLYEIGPDLESQRIAKDEATVFSWRFAPDTDGRMYDRSSNYSGFNKECLRRVNEADCSHVVVADIADFFAHIYFHPVEQALMRVESKAKARCVLQMIKNWNAKVSYGLPTGLAGSRILAEATISDVDVALRAHNVNHCRYSDDFRLFCSSEKSAYESLEYLAWFLFERHGLTLNGEKTDVLTAAEYEERFSLSPKRLEIESLDKKFNEWLEDSNIDDDYEAEIDFDDLPDDVQDELRELNLQALLSEQLERDRCDPIVMSFLLHRLGQLNIDVSEDLFTELPALSHVIDPVVRYFCALRDTDEATRMAIGEAVVEACSTAPMSSYHRSCLLSVFSSGDEFDNEDKFEELYEQFTDASTRRKLVLALGHAAKEHWFLPRRRDATTLDPWQKRAFFAGFSCVDADARGPYYATARQGADVLELAVIDWVADHPF